MVRGETSQAPRVCVRVLVADSTRMGTALILSALREDRRFKAVGTLASAAAFAAALSEANPDVMVIAAGASASARGGWLCCATDWLAFPG